MLCLPVQTRNQPQVLVRRPSLIEAFGGVFEERAGGSDLLVGGSQLSCSQGQGDAGCWLGDYESRSCCCCYLVGWGSQGQGCELGGKIGGLFR